MSTEIRTRLRSILDILVKARDLYQDNNLLKLDKPNFMEELIKEVEIFLFTVNNTSSSSLTKIYKEIRTANLSDIEKKSLTNFLDLKKSSLDTFNREVLNQLDELNLERFKSLLFNVSKDAKSDNLEVMKDQVKKIRIQFKKYYENIENELIEFRQKYIEINLKINHEFHDFVNEKKKEIDISISTFENRVKSITSKYDIASDDLDKIHEIVLEVNKNLKSNYDDIQVIQKNIANLNSTYNNEVILLKNELDIKLKDIEGSVQRNSQEKLLKYIDQVDEVNKLMMDDFESIKNTTKKFSEFMSDQTSNKLTNDYKNKAEGEMLAYYSFTALSFIIIFIAMMSSWNTLHTFAAAHVGNGKDYNNLDLIYLGIRLIFSLIIFSSVTYTSRLASKSYMHWKKNEGIFLRLTALKSFIADMSVSKKEEIHEKLVDVYFGKDEQEQNMNQKLKDLPNNITQLLGKVVDQTSVVLDASKHKKEGQPPASGQTGG